MNLRFSKWLLVLLLFLVAILLTSCTYEKLSQAWYENENRDSGYTFKGFVEFYENGVEPKEDYTFTYERSKWGDDNTLFTIKVTRKGKNLTYKIKDDGWKEITEEEFEEKFPSEKFFTSISDIYKFFIDYCNNIQQNGGEILQDYDENKEISGNCRLFTRVYENKKYKCPSEIEIQSFMGTESTDNPLDKLFADGYRIYVYDFKLL